jgi:hypothetical protein
MHHAHVPEQIEVSLPSPALQHVWFDVI